MTEQNKLKACPFCGGEGVMQTMRGGEDTMLTFVQCKSCEATQEAVEDAYSDPATAAMRWNTRTGATEQNKAVEAILSEAKRYAAQEQCDFIGYMSSALFAYTEAFESGSEPTGSDLDEARENIASLAALSLAQHIIINSESQEQALAALSRPTQTADAVEAAANAMQNAVLDDGEGTTHRLFDLLDFSGENKSRIITRQLAKAALSHTATSEVEPVYTLTLEINGDSQTELMLQGEAAYMEALKVIRDDGRADVIGIVEKTPQIETGDISDLITDVLAEIAEARSEAVQRPPTPTHDSGLAGEAEDLKVLDDAWRLIQMTWLNMRLLGLKDRGDDVSLKHELRMMALAFSKDAQGQGSFKKGNGQMLQVMDGLKKLRATLTAPQSNSDSELLRALSREVIATCKTEYGMLPEDLLARLEQGAA